MSKIITVYLLQTLTLVVTTYLIPGITIDSLVAALIAGLIVALINSFIKPILQFLALPISIISLGLFALLINTGLFALAAAIVPGFHISNFWWAFLGAIVFSIISAFLSWLVERE